MRNAVRCLLIGALAGSTGCIIYVGSDDPEESGEPDGGWWGGYPDGGDGQYPDADGGPTTDAEVSTGPAVSVEARLTADAESHAEFGIPVSGCIAGGIDGFHTAYEEADTDVRSRNLNVAVDLAVSAQLEVAGMMSGIDYDGVFGVTVDGNVSSAGQAGGVNGDIIPTFFGVWWRRAVRVDRVAELWALTESGDEVWFGTATLYDWDFVHALAQDSYCPPLPAPAGW